jgi:hypothetical protein
MKPVAFELCCHAPKARLRRPVRACVWHSGTDLHLAILVPTAESWPEGRASIGAISLAIDEVNAQAQGALLGPMIRGRNITYSWKEVDCDRSKALAALSQILEEGPVDAVIGPDCSAACESTAILTSGRELPQISYSCSSAALSDKTAYPTVRLARGPRLRITGVRYARSSALPLRTIRLAVCSHDIELYKLDAGDIEVHAMGAMDSLRHRRRNR